MSSQVTFVVVFAFLFIGIPIVYYRMRQRNRREEEVIEKHFIEFIAEDRND